MTMGRRTGQIVVAALLLAAGCGGSDDSQPPLPLTEANAQAVAAEALIAAGQITTGVQTPTGGLPLAATSPMPGAGRAVQRLMSRATGTLPVAPGSMTEACAAGGSTTTVSSGTSETVTYNNCQEDANTRINGTVKLTIKTSSGGTSSDLSFSVSVNLTVTTGTLSFAESGGYDLHFKLSADPSSSGTELELTGSRLSVSVSGGTAASDKLTLSNFDIDVKEDLSNTPSQQVETIDYDIDSSRLKGHISVMTNHPVMQILGAEFPHAGQVLIAGANHTRLQITILGDETSTPPSGQGQVEIELDTGSGTFGAPIWVNWATLKSLVGSTP